MHDLCAMDIKRNLSNFGLNKIPLELSYELKQRTDIVKTKNAYAQVRKNVKRGKHVQPASSFVL